MPRGRVQASMRIVEIILGAILAVVFGIVAVVELGPQANDAMQVASQRQASSQPAPQEPAPTPKPAPTGTAKPKVTKHKTVTHKKKAVKHARQPAPPATYAQAILDAGIVAPVGWIDRTGDILCADWARGMTKTQTNDDVLLPGGVHSYHLARYNRITVARLCPSH